MSPPDMDDVIEDIFEMLDTLPWDLQEPLEEAVEFALFCAFQFRRWNVKVRKGVANIAGHNIIKVLKVTGYDTPGSRREAYKWLVPIFGLDDTWKPKWLPGQDSL